MVVTVQSSGDELAGTRWGSSEAPWRELCYIGSMESEVDLRTASREALWAVIARQQAVISQLQRMIEVLEGKSKPGGPRGMPGHKPQPRRKPPKERGPGKPRPYGFARRRMTPTQQVDHAVETCPDCGTGLSGS